MLHNARGRPRRGPGHRRSTAIRNYSPFAPSLVITAEGGTLLGHGHRFRAAGFDLHDLAVVIEILSMRRRDCRNVALLLERKLHEDRIDPAIELESDASEN